jgi:hypothetical protein
LRKLCERKNQTQLRIADWLSCGSVKPILAAEKFIDRNENGDRALRPQFSLPEDADAEKVNAEFHDGVLKLHIATLPFKGRRLARHIVVPN